jgi:hypothetical protein
VAVPVSRGREGRVPGILDLALDEDEWSVSHSGRCNLGQRELRTH